MLLFQGDVFSFKTHRTTQLLRLDHSGKYVLMCMSMYVAELLPEKYSVEEKIFKEVV